MKMSEVFCLVVGAVFLVLAILFGVNGGSEVSVWGNIICSSIYLAASWVIGAQDKS